MSVTKFMLGDIPVDVVKKNVKNINLSVHIPTGRVRVSAPLRMSAKTIRTFAVSKLAWIERQQQKSRHFVHESPPKYLNNEHHYAWGNCYRLEVVEHDSLSGINIDQDRMILRVKRAADANKKKSVVERWYREQLNGALPPLIAGREKQMNVQVERFMVRKMKTRWGSCTPGKRSIRLSLELAKRRPECLEYVVVHELTHLLEPSHNARFVSFMDEFMPDWRVYRDELNCRFPAPTLT